ncbi:MAG: DUF695 domain-containing protein [Clostridia bacterium]|nr:DUF695 domain-containing protein [Clostridia bacterium]
MAEELFSYDWHMDGAPAKFLVDMELRDADLAAMPYLLYVRSKSRQGTFTGREIKHLADLEKKCRKKLMGAFAGSIQSADQQVIFFYVYNAEEAELVQDLAERERLLQCTVGVREEPERDTYRKVLYPDAARLFTEQNRKQLLLLKKHGDALTPARRVTLHAFFPAEPLVGIFAEQARMGGFAVGEYEYEPDQDLPYGVSLCRVSTLDKGEIDAMTSQVIRLAARYDGSLSYWNCPIVGKISPFR